MYPRDRYPTGGIFVHEQVKALQRLGFEVVVLSGEPFWISTYNPLHILRALHAWRNQPVRWSRWDGVPVMYFPYCVGGIFRDWCHAWTYLQGALRVMQQVRARVPFDLVHAHTSFLDGYTAVRVGKRFGCPVVLTEHMGPFSVLTRNAAFRHFTRAGVNGADRVLAVSRSLKKDMLAELGKSAERVQVLGNGFDPAVHSPTPPAEPSGAGPRMLWVGHVSPIKGVDRLIRAMKRASTEAPGLELTLLGGSEGMDAVREQASALGIEDRLSVLPAGTRAEVAAAMRAHDFLVVSSFKETFSLVALEALACGRPVLTTACGGPEDFVLHGENGLIVPNSEEALASGIAEMARIYSRFDMTQVAARFRETYSWDKVANNLAQIYKKLLSARPLAPVISSVPRTRVLMITTDHLMIDRRILQEADTLRKAGYEVEILAGFECPKAEDYRWRDVHISRFVFDWNDTRAQRLLRFVKRRNNGLWPYLWRATCKLLALTTGLSSFEHYVLRQVEERKFDVLHVHDYPLLRTGVEVKRRRGCTLVYDAHELYHGQAQLPAEVRKRYRRREKRLIHAANVAITVNWYIAAMMARDYRCQLPQVLLNAAPQVSLERPQSTLRARLGLAEEARLVLYQGWMSAERGIDSLVRAAAYFPANIHLVLIGYGDCEPQLKTISHEQGTDDGRVIFMGRIEPELLATLTWEADLGVIPYRPVDLNHLYCSPNKLFEFAVAGVPFLANDLPFLRDIAEEHGFGVITDLDRPESIAAAVTSALADSHRYAELKRAAVEAGSRLNWEIEGGKLLDIYAQLPAAARPSGAA
ncbi:glycosyltransferase [Bradyrhizobium sp. 6(2017)]|uniref:glycosyltransferase n=1 Tax=Bradyrhizobium sp. 6(2017) TaxID=1197460 RepID=UPI0013E1A296|nr:glycosyltransferase [Bradyrhizobium sp. 6(2017)]QIG91096.1 glycosyltransferase [Bradyrhizobium sp. 6(2017)]